MKSNFIYSESDPSDVYDTHHFSKHSNFDDDMAFFDKTTVQFLQKNHYHRKVLKFVLDCIPSFDAKISATKNKVDETPSNKNGNFQQVFHLKN